jgi:hypothetical protein
MSVGDSTRPTRISAVPPAVIFLLALSLLSLAFRRHLSLPLVGASQFANTSSQARSRATEPLSSAPRSRVATAVVFVPSTALRRRQPDAAVLRCASRTPPPPCSVAACSAAPGSAPLWSSLQCGQRRAGAWRSTAWPCAAAPSAPTPARPRTAAPPEAKEVKQGSSQQEHQAPPALPGTCSLLISNSKFQLVSVLPEK